jgi:hypothetical protein
MAHDYCQDMEGLKRNPSIPFYFVMTDRYNVNITAVVSV